MQQDGAFHHYIWEFDGARAKGYRDNVQIFDVACATAGITAAAMMVENRRTASGTIIFDNICVFAGVFSSTERASLAAGNMPNASGVIP